jgi:hypothetical protein
MSTIGINRRAALVNLQKQRNRALTRNASTGTENLPKLTRISHVMARSKNFKVNELNLPSQQKLAKDLLEINPNNLNNHDTALAKDFIRWKVGTIRQYADKAFTNQDRSIARNLRDAMQRHGIEKLGGNGPFNTISRFAKGEKFGGGR